MRLGFTLDGRELDSGRQVRARSRGGARVVAAAARGRALPRAVVPITLEGGHRTGLGSSGQPLEYRAPVTGNPGRAAKIACRAQRSSQRARVAWDADFRKITAAGSHRR
jgi:hypothetical protein